MNTLQRLSELYGVEDIETVHVISGAASLSLSALFDGEPKPRGLKLPRGHYIILRLVEAPVERVGMFAVVAPKPESTLGGDETLGGNPRGQV